jgi:hypothetical protein
MQTPSNIPALIEAAADEIVLTRMTGGNANENARDYLISQGVRGQWITILLRGAISLANEQKAEVVRRIA